MKNYVGRDENVTIAAPAAVSSGDAVLVGSLFGVAQADAASGADVALVQKGIFKLPKLTTDVMAVGNKVNWNDTNKELQLATSDLDNVATVLKAAGNGVTEVEVVLTSV